MELDESRTPAEHIDLLRRAIETGGLQLHYQPEVDLRDGSIVGAEALLRWPGAPAGLATPTEFVALAERCGLIVPLGAFVIDQAVAASAHLSGKNGRPVRVWVNLGAGQLADPDQLLDTIDRALRSHGSRPDLVGVELTETTLLHSLDGASAAMNELRERGVEVALDDFGTGYSSLAYLRHLPVDVLKIDRSFVSGMRDSLQDGAIVEAIVELAHTLGLAVIAEGVESPRQVEELLALGATRGQGYLFARPAPAREMRSLLAQPWAAWAGPPACPSGHVTAVDHRADGFLGGGRRAALLLTALDALTTPVVMTSRERVVYVNAAFEEVTGLAPDAVVDRRVTELDAATAPEPDPAGTVTFETFAVRADGSTFPCEVTRAPVPSGSGAVRHWIEVRRDLTEQRALESRLARELAMRELNASFAARCLSSCPEDVLSRSSLAALAEAVGRLLNVERVYLDLLDLERGELDMQARWTPTLGRETDDLRVPTASRPDWVRTITTAPVVLLDGTQVDPPPWWHEQLAFFGVASPVQLAAPLRVDDRTYGVIGVGVDTPGSRRWDDDEIAFLRMLATSMASLLERVRVDGVLRDSEARYRLLAETAADVIVVADASGTVTWVSPSVTELTGHSPEELVGIHCMALVHPDDVPGLLDRLAAAAQEQRATVDHRVRHKDHGWVWVQQVVRIMRDDRGAITGSRSSVRDITAQKALEQELARRATHDPLTGLAHRSAIEDQLEAASGASDAPVALMLVDLDGFKSVNDQFGHRIGDRLLRQVAARISAVVRTVDVVSRWGGDEFVLLCPDTDETVAASIASRVVATIAQPFSLDVEPTEESGARRGLGARTTVTVTIGASVGVAFSAPDRRGSDALLAAADDAMYEAKRRGRGRVHLSLGRTPAH